MKLLLQKKKFLLFNKYEEKLDSFLVPYLDSKDYEYHGQAAVKRGFNVRKNIWLKICKKIL